MKNRFEEIRKTHGVEKALQWLKASAMIEHGASMGEGWRESYDWKEAFRYADNVRVNKGCSPDPFGISDVLVMIHMDEGENDGDPWIAAGILKDGRYFFLSAGCDYTGWDCQAGGDSQVAGSYEDLIRYCMGEQDRERFGITLE